MRNLSTTKDSRKAVGFLTAVIASALVLWLSLLMRSMGINTGRDALILLASAPLIMIVGLFPINFPLPSSWKATQENVTFTLMDAFVLAIAGWYGMGPAVLIAGVEAFASSRRLVRRFSSNLFSASMMSLAAAAASCTLSLVLGSSLSGAAIARNHSISAVTGALLVASIVQVAVNWSLVSTLLALRHKNSIFLLLKQNLIVAFPLFLPTSVVASVIFLTAQNGALAMVAIGGPVLLAIYVGHSQNGARAEHAERIERERAEDAERHVAELSRYIEEQESILEKFAQMEKLSAVGELASGVAHNFNNTLAGILGRAQLLQAHSKDSAAVERGLDIIIKTATDGAKIVKRIQDFARQRRDHDFEALAVDQLLSEVSEITRPRWKDRAQAANIYIDMDLRLNTNASVMGDASELREVIVNIIFNAVDAMPGGGKITLSAEELAGQVIIRITDTGAGMTEEVRSKVFDPFFTTKGKAGMGLGLAVSYGIICRHEGRVEVESTIGQGTSFIITLPITRTTPTRLNNDSVAKQAKAASESHRVLVVDDESFIRELLREILESQGHVVAEAEDGLQALELFDSESFDAVFTDVGMPGMSGWDLAKEIRQRNADVPLVVLTGWGEAVSSNERKTAEVNWVVAKPFDLSRIIETLKDISRLRLEQAKRQSALSLVA